MSSDQQRTEKIIRTHVHDVRNFINSLDLEAVLLSELTTDSEVNEILRQMRSQLGQLEAEVKALMFKFAEPKPFEVTAGDLLQLWKHQIAPLENATHKIEWTAPPASAALVSLDAHAVLSVIRELVIAAWGRSPGATLKAAVRTTEEGVCLELREPVPRKPLSPDAHQEHQRLVELNGGKFQRDEDAVPGESVVTLSFCRQHSPTALTESQR